MLLWLRVSVCMEHGHCNALRRDDHGISIVQMFWAPTFISLILNGERGSEYGPESLNPSRAHLEINMEPTPRQVQARWPTSGVSFLSHPMIRVFMLGGISSRTYFGNCRCRKPGLFRVTRCIRQHPKPT